MCEKYAEHSSTTIEYSSLHPKHEFKKAKLHNLRYKLLAQVRTIGILSSF